MALPKQTTTQDYQTIFLTTLHFKTDSSHIIAWAKIVTGAEAFTVPLSHFKKMFPPNQPPQYPYQRCTTVYGKNMDRSQWIPQKFLGQIILDFYHKTAGRSYPTRSYTFKDTTNPLILIFYASNRLGILQFTLPNKIASAQIHCHYSLKPKNTSCAVLHTPFCPFQGPYQCSLPRPWFWNP